MVKDSSWRPNNNLSAAKVVDLRTDANTAKNCSCFDMNIFSKSLHHIVNLNAQFSRWCENKRLNALAWLDDFKHGQAKCSSFSRAGSRLANNCCIWLAHA